MMLKHISCPVSMLFLQKRAEESGEDSDDNAAKIDGKLMQLAFDVRSAAGLHPLPICTAVGVSGSLHEIYARTALRRSHAALERTLCREAWTRVTLGHFSHFFTLSHRHLRLGT